MHLRQPRASFSFLLPFCASIPLSVCLLHVSILVSVWRHIPSPSSSIPDLSAHLHVTTCIDFGFLPGLSGCLIKAILLFSISYINNHWILVLVLFMLSLIPRHGLVLCWRFLALRVCLKMPFVLASGVASTSLLI